MFPVLTRAEREQSQNKQTNTTLPVVLLRDFEGATFGKLYDARLNPTRALCQDLLYS